MSSVIEGPKLDVDQKGSNTRRATLTVKSKVIQEHSDIPDPDLLTAWYTLEQNSVPPVYVLQKIR